MLRDSSAFSGFSVDNLQKAKAFYAETLGLEVVDGFETGTLDLRLHGGGHVFIYPKGQTGLGTLRTAWTLKFSPDWSIARWISRARNSLSATAPTMPSGTS